MSEIYEQPNQQPEKQDNTLAIVSLVCACASFLINPFGLVVLTAIVTGVIALTKKCNKGLAIAGLCVAGAEIIFEIVLAIFTMGMSCIC